MLLSLLLLYETEAKKQIFGVRTFLLGLSNEMRK